MNEHERDLYDEFVKRHCKAFKISREEFCKNRPEVPLPVIVENSSNQPFEPYVKFRIDMRFSVNRILKELGKQVRHFKKVYETDFEQFVRNGESGMPACHTDLAVTQMKKGRLVRQEASLREIETYRRQLEVYDLRERDGHSFAEILKRCKWASQLHEIYNDYTAAKRWIDVGPPFGPPFRL